MPENNLAMPLAAMKKVLKQGTDRALSCAFGMAKNQAALLLNVRMAPTLLVKQLSAGVKDIQQPGFGKAACHPDDAKHLRLDVNRCSKGTAKHLIRTLKGTGIRKVSILVDEALFETAQSEEPEEDELPDEADTNAEIPATPRGKSPPPVPPRAARHAPDTAHEADAAIAQLAQFLSASATLPQDEKASLAASLKQARADAASGDADAAQALIATVQQALAGSGGAENGSGSNDTGSSSPGSSGTGATVTSGAGWARTDRSANASPRTNGVSLGRGSARPGLQAPERADVGPQVAMLAAQQSFAHELQRGQADIRAAQALPGNGPDKQELARLTGEMTQKAGSKDYAGAKQMLGTVRAKAIAITAQNGRQTAQRGTYDRMAPVLDRVEKTYFTKASGDALRMADLKAGPEFQAYVAAVSTFEQSRTPQACDGVHAAAERYLLHYQNDLSSRQQNTKESQAKRRHAINGYVGSGHMKIALEMKQVGAPPWTDDTATKVASMRAAFAFESAGTQAKLLGGEETGVSASFWVKGFDPTATDGDGIESEYLFKPAITEEAEIGFEDGGSAPREAVSKAVADKVQAMIGIDLKVPETNIVSLDPRTVDVAGYNARAGDDAKRLPSNQPLIGSMQQFKASDGMLKQQPPGTLAAIPAAECQRAALLDILTLNCDRHHGNFMVGKQTDATGAVQPTLIPIDHGLTLPTRAGMAARGPDRMSDPEFNALLKMPGSYQPFPAEMLDRIEMLDPDGIEAGMRDSIASLDRVHPGLRTAELLPDDSIKLAKRAAMFLKRAARQLAPAQIQVALAIHQAEIFDVDDAGFAQSADGVIATYAANPAGFKTLFCDVSQDDVVKKLAGLGWFDFNGAWRSGVQGARPWLAANANLAAAAYANNMSPPPGWVKPT